MNKKMIIGLSVASVAVLAAGGIIAGVVISQQSSETKPAVKPVDARISNSTSSSVDVVFQNLDAYKGKTLSVFVKSNSSTTWPTTATKTFTVSKTEETQTLSGLTASTKYDLELKDGNNVVLTKTGLFTTLSDQPTPPVNPNPPEVPNPVSALVTSLSVDKATLQFSGLEANAKVFLEYVNNASTSTTAWTKTSVQTVTDTKTVTFELANLSANTTYKYVLKQEKSGEETEDKKLFESTAETNFKTHENPALTSLATPTGVTIEATGLQDYENRQLVYTVYKSASAPAAGAAGAAVTASAKRVQDSGAAGAGVGGGTPVAPSTPTPTPTVVFARTGVVKNHKLLLEITGLDSSESYVVHVTEADNAKRVVLLSTTFNTNSEANVTTKFVGPRGASINVTNLNADYKGKTLVVKYAEKVNSKTEEESLKNSTTFVETVLSKTSLDSTTNVLVNLTGLSPNRTYYYQVYLKDAPNSPLIKSAKELTSTPFVSLKDNTTAAPNPSFKLNSAKLVFENVASFKDKKLSLKYALTSDGLNNEDASKVKVKTLTTAISEGTTEVSFDLTELDSEAVYEYQVFEENSNIPLLAEKLTFLSAKAAVLKVDNITSTKAVLKLSKLDGYVNRSLKVQYAESPVPITSGAGTGPGTVSTWNDLTNGTFTPTNLDKDTKQFNLDSSTFTSDKKWLVRVIIASGSSPDEVVIPQSNEFQLPKLEKVAGTTSYTFNFSNMASFQTNKFKLKYRIQNAETWTQYWDDGAFTLSSITGTETGAKPSLKLQNLEAGKTYQVSLTTTNSSGEEYSPFDLTTFITLPNPLIGTKAPTSTDSAIVTVSGVSAYENMNIYVKYRKDSDPSATWTESSKTMVSSSNKTNTLEFTLSSLEAGTSYQYEVFAKGAGDSDQEIAISTEMRIFQTQAAAAAGGGSSSAPSAAATSGGATAPAAAESSESRTAGTPAAGSGTPGSGS